MGHEGFFRNFLGVMEIASHPCLKRRGSSLAPTAVSVTCWPLALDVGLSQMTAVTDGPALKQRDPVGGPRGFFLRV
jgi:hypothetical protein